MSEFAVHAETAYQDAELAASMPDYLAEVSPVRDSTLNLLRAQGAALHDVPETLVDDVSTIITAAEQTATALAAGQAPGAATAPLRSKETTTARTAIAGYLLSCR
ncbi:hypothetical protein HLB23_01940 [Nocardia uniformis]|uniref:Uncharacterized protein n=1 Tax=Nocardia uniformis TaxID=53432 RepID=A0A849BPL6_9NOCA|nr:hypothetical protein [Nocardia uniformis]NNH68652.1 hypothetical protein [Nocardia uniformis]